MPARPIALIILDGWGFRTREHGNAVAQAHTPNFDRWSKTLERAMLEASGEAVGLPQDQMGNSEVGHLNLGAGFVVYQDLVRIDKSISDGTFFQSPALLATVQQSKDRGGKVHAIDQGRPGGGGGARQLQSPSLDTLGGLGAARRSQAVVVQDFLPKR